MTGKESHMLKCFAVAAAMTLVASPTWAAPCKDAKGRFTKCPEKSAKAVRCKTANGKFAKCGTAGARPV